MARTTASLALALTAAVLLGVTWQAGRPAEASKPATRAATATPSTTYAVDHSLDLGDLPEGAKRARIWFWMPEDRPGQTLLDFELVGAPEGTQITRDPRYGRSWIYADVDLMKFADPKIATRFQLRREVVSGRADAAKARPIGDAHRRAFEAELRLDEAHMEVTDTMRQVADDLCGTETNPVVQARKIFDYVIAKSDHYSVNGTMPEGQCLGDAAECLAGTGDCCTDQHALFIALARARGIPCRLVFGSRLQPKNAGKAHDPGYRCWPTFFAPGLGWVPLDISAADAAGEDTGRWFGGLDDRRLEWSRGRSFPLSPASDVQPDLVIRAWVEVDGKRYDGFRRTLTFRELSLAR